MTELSAIAFIPARKYSKRLPGKNKKKLGDMPLFEYTILAALNSKCYEMVVLSTDDEEIAALGKRINGVVTLERPKKYAEDHVRAKDVVLYHLKHIQNEFEYVSLLMPTSPFRDANDIKKSFDILISQGMNSIASVVEYDFHPGLAIRLEGNGFRSYFGGDFEWIRESDFEKAFHFNGAIFTAKTRILLETGTFIHKDTLAYKMSAIKSIDIDDELDFRVAQLILMDNLL